MTVTVTIDNDLEALNTSQRSKIINRLFKRTRQVIVDVAVTATTSSVSGLVTIDFSGVTQLTKIFSAIIITNSFANGHIEYIPAANNNPATGEFKYIVDFVGTLRADSLLADDIVSVLLYGQ